LFASVACSIQVGGYFSGVTKKSDGTPMFIYGITTADEAIEFVITSLSFGIATIVVAVPVGLSIAVRLNFAKTTKKMRKDKVLVQSPSAFERMGSVTTILCHQTGIVTLNQAIVSFYMQSALSCFRLFFFLSTHFLIIYFLLSRCRWLMSGLEE
jgi:Ca2+-transporting ATPase